MKHLWLAMGLLWVSLPALGQEAIQGKWYRGDLYSEATLTVDEKLHFTIEANHTAHSGEIEGDLEKLNDGQFFAKVFDDVIGQRAVLIFTLDEAGVDVVVYGDQVGAGYSVSYDGKYHSQPLSDEERRSDGLDQILGPGYSHAKARELLGPDVDYFIECFASKDNLDTAGTGFVELATGFMPGVAPYENGILGYNQDALYILFTDCRDDPNVYQFYTDDPKGEWPPAFSDWLKANPELKIIRHVPRAQEKA